MDKLRVNVDRLNCVARELTSEERNLMEARRRDRHWMSASSAIASKIKRYLRVNGITNMEFAEMLGITPANVTRYLNGKTNFELRTLVEIERALGLHIIDREVVPQKEKKAVAIQVIYSGFDTESTEREEYMSVNMSVGKNRNKVKSTNIWDYA